MLCLIFSVVAYMNIAGAEPGFQVRGAHLKKLRREEGRAKFFGVFRVKNHDFTSPPLEAPLHWAPSSSPINHTILHKSKYHNDAAQQIPQHFTDCSWEVYDYVSS